MGDLNEWGLYRWINMGGKEFVDLNRGYAVVRVHMGDGVKKMFVGIEYLEWRGRKIGHLTWWLEIGWRLVVIGFSVRCGVSVGDRRLR